jgi:hypothetical protein
MSYLYKTVLFKDTTNVVPVPIDNTVDLADFEGNHKAYCQMIDEVVLAGVTFSTWEIYTAFDGYVDGSVIVWADVKCIETDKTYELNLLTNNPL